jgi:hypothetical protein
MRREFLVTDAVLFVVFFFLSFRRFDPRWKIVSDRISDLIATACVRRERRLLDASSYRTHPAQRRIAERGGYWTHQVTGRIRRSDASLREEVTGRIQLPDASGAATHR